MRLFIVDEVPSLDLPPRFPFLPAHIRHSASLCRRIFILLPFLLPFSPFIVSQDNMQSESVRGAVPPPPGVEPNFTNPVYRSAGIVPITAVFVTLSTAFLAVRTYTKAHIIKIFGLEDCTCPAPNKLLKMSTYETQIRFPWHGYKHLHHLLSASHALTSMVSCSISAYA